MIPTRYRVIWGLQGLLVALAMFAPGEWGWWFALVAFVWFGIFETVGLCTTRTDDALSNSIWALLDVEEGRVLNKALSPLVGGIFAAAGVLFVGLVQGIDEGPAMPGWAPIVAAVCVAGGTLWFLKRHFAWGGNRRPK